MIDVFGAPRICFYGSLPCFAWSLCKASRNTRRMDSTSPTPKLPSVSRTCFFHEIQGRTSATGHEIIGEGLSRFHYDCWLTHEHFHRVFVWIGRT
jgi:hypothetical protein